MKKILIVLIISMFILSMLPGIIGENETVEYTIKGREYIENRDIIPILTAQGLERVPNGKGKPENPGGGKNKAPSVTITNPVNGATVTGIVIITVEVNDKEDEPDPTPVIEIDGVQVAVDFTYEWDTEPEDVGSHTITATATDSGEKTGSDSVTVTKGGDYGPVDKYALVIGISNYQDPVNDLKYCDDDAQDWKNFLTPEYSVTTLIDSQATLDGIVAAVDNLLANEDGNDYVVVTYSGHGTKYQGYGSCIVSHDLWYITHGWFEAEFANADSPHIYFTFDACQIGDFKGLVTNNRVGAFASNRRYAYDGDQYMQNGVFTYYQMEGWDSYDNFEEDGSYAVQNMKAWAGNYGIRVDPFVQDMYAGPMMP